MKLNFCTLFFANYSAKGVALYHSLERMCPDFHLYIVAMDDVCTQILQGLSLQYATIISIEELEGFYPTLKTIKKTRNKGEYSWTCKGPTLQYCLEKYQLKDCSYLDSDLYFFSDPTPLYQECPDADVMLMDHQYTPWYNYAETNGRYCAGYLYFKSTPNGLRVLRTWTDQCIDWCYGRHEDGKFGDQKYLDSFHERFDNVHDLQHIGLCAPWNVQQYEITKENDGLYARKNGTIDKLILFHFHFLKNQDFGKFNEFYLGPYRLCKSVMSYIYEPYLNELKQTCEYVDTLYETDALASSVLRMSMLQYMWHWCKNAWKRNKIQWIRK